MKKRRRQVAWVCFEPHLPEAQRLEAIQILEQSFQQDSISNLIAYVTRICSDFGIDAGIRKPLYGQFHEMMGHESDLQIDPLSLLHEKAPPIAPETEALVSVPEAITQIEADVAKVEITPNTSPPSIVAILPPTPTNDVPLHAKMFAHFIEQLLNYLPNKSDFFEALGELSINKNFSNKKIELQINAWLSDADSFIWSENLPEKNLAEIVHLIYHAFCDILGPVNADDIFHKAIANCEQLPEARQFSPTRFL
ncbi:MAG: hypothetical protein PHU14_14855 [Methylovulum sp.]|nr:hypothetical protein [Methylovulum sp.]